MSLNVSQPSGLKKRIIAALDVKDGRTVKGVQFENLRDAGDPIELAAHYSRAGIDELVFLDICATHEKRGIFVDLVEKVASQLDIPFTVGGGIKELVDVARLLEAGADKVFINSAVLQSPSLIESLAAEFGCQCVVVAIDARQEGEHWRVYSGGGRVPSKRELFSWAREAADRGAGEIMFTSMTHDGAQAGYAIEATKKLTQELRIPVIASGGAGSIQHFSDVFLKADADAALAASVFHFGQISLPELKQELLRQGVAIRI